MDSERLNALVIGAGSIGERHLRCFQATGRFVVAACEKNTETGRTITEKYGCRTYSDLEEAVLSAEVDVAVICTLANTHIPIATSCVRKGLHVLIEKPLALTPEGIGELEELAESSKKIVRVAYTARAVPGLLSMKSLLAERAIGAVRHISVVSGQHFPTYRPAYRTIYYRSHETGGGAIQDALTHQVHTVEWLVGPIRRVFATAMHKVLEGVSVEDTVNLNAVLEDGTPASFAFNQFQAPNETTIQFNGTMGSLRYESHEQRLGIFRHGDAAWTWLESHAEDRDGPFIRQANYFFDEVRGKSTSLATLAEGMQTLKVNQRALESARNHREVEIV